MRVTSASLLTILSAGTTGLAAVTPVAVSGTTAPGGGTYSAFAAPSLNASGKVTFLAALNGGTTNANLFSGTTGLVQALALQGTAAPAGGSFNLINTTIAVPPTSNAAGGPTIFYTTLTGGTSTFGAFAGTAGSLQTVALQGTAAPSGGNYSTINNPPAMNSSGQIAFSGSLTGGTSTGGLFFGTPGSLQTVALIGDAAPGGGNFATVIAAPVLNNVGQVAFISLAGTAQGIFAGTPGSLQRAMLSGTAAPGAGTAVYGNPATGISYNNSGQVAFTSSLTGGTSTSGVFFGAPGSVSAAALNNTAPPAGGGTFSTFGGVSSTGDGKVVFTGNITGGTATSGLFTGTPGSITPFVLQGSATPIAGATISSIGSSGVPNAVGQIMFLANLAGADITTANDSVLFAGRAGDYTSLVREGDVIDVDPSVGIDNRTVTAISLIVGSGGQDGKAVPFNDSGVGAFRLTFTDGSTGIFTAAVPEPTGLALAAIAGVGALRRRVRKA